MCAPCRLYISFKTYGTYQGALKHNKPTYLGPNIYIYLAVSQTTVVLWKIKKTMLMQYRGLKLKKKFVHKRNHILLKNVRK